MLLLLVAFGGWLTPANAQVTVQLGSGTGTASYFPNYYLYDYSYSQTIYTAAEMTTAGAPGAGLIDKIRYKPTAGVSTSNWKDWVVYMANTNKAGFASVSDYVPVGSLTQVFSGTLPANTTANVWMELTLTTPFFWDGTSNLVVAVDENTAGWGNTPSWAGYTMTPSSGSKGVYFYRDGTDIPPSAPAGTQGVTNTVAQIQLNFLIPCSGTPTAGTLPATVPVCAGSTYQFTPAGLSLVANLTYQWEESADNVTWGPATGTNTNSTYTTPPFSSPMYYRMVVTCTNSGMTDTTNVAHTILLSTPPYYAFDGVSYTQSFESWTSGCSTNDMPSFNWLNTPSTGKNSWRRHDQGASAGWTSPNSGLYSPVSTAGSYSARFHTTEAATGSVGTLDFYVDMSASTDSVKLTFEYINADGTDILRVYLSQDGGTTFAQLGPGLGQATTWATTEYTIRSSSPTAVIRFAATADIGVLGGSDIGLDNFRLKLPCTGTPAAATVAASPATICSGSTSVLTATGISTLAGVTVQWEQSNDGVSGWTPIAGANSATYTTPALTANRYYRLVTACAYSGLINHSNVVGVMQQYPAYAAYNGTLFTESFETWNSFCNTNDAPTNWRTTPFTGNPSWRRNDQGASAGWSTATGGAYSPTSTAGTYSARFHSNYAPAQTTGDLDLFINMSAATGPTRMTLDVANTSGTDVLQVHVSQDGGITFAQLGGNIPFVATPTWNSYTFDFTSVSPTTVIRLRAVSDYGGTDIGVDNFKLEPAPTCLPPTNLTANGSGVFNWTASLSGPSQGYEWEVRSSGAPGSGNTGLEESGTTGAGVTTASATGLTMYQTYTVYVRANCGGGDLSAWTNGVTFTMGVTQVGDGATTTSYFPIYSCYGYNYSQQIYLASEVLGMDPYITKIAFKFVSGTTTLAAAKDWVVYMGNTSQASFANTSNWIPLASLSPVFNGSITSTPTNGTWIEITLDTPFLWDGTSNIVVAVDENTASYNCTAAWAAYPAGSNRGLLYYSDGTNPNPASPPTANYGPNANIAQIRFYSMEAPGCTPPTGLGASGVTGTSANFSWTASGSSPLSYDWELHTPGSTPDNSTGLVDNGNTAGTTASTSLLSGNTTYHLFVQSNCVGDESPWAGPYSFTTPCTATNVPYFENFNSVTTPAIPTCMSLQTISGNAWRTALAPTGMTGNVANVTYTSSGSPPMNSWLFTQGLQLQAGSTYRLSYKYFNNSTFYTERMSVSYGTGNTEGDMTDLLADHSSILTTTVQTNSVDFTPATTGVYYIGFKCYSIDNQNQLYLDDIDVQELSACAGTPDPGNTTGPSMACSGATFSLGISNDPGITSGYTYQWQTSDDGTVWTDAAGTGKTFSTSQTTATWYRVLMTCVAEAATEASAPLLVDMGDNCLCASYCTATNQGSACITNVTLNTLNNSTGCTTNAGYYSFQTATTTLAQALTYTFSMTCDADAITSVWFDWNGDGTFSPSEWYQVYTTGTTGSVQVTVPASSVLGNVRMRVRSRLSGNPNGSGDACTALGSGETEDYCITIVAGDACTETPDPGATTGPAMACPGTNFTLGISDTYNFSGISYQWYASTDGGLTYTAVGGNTPTLTISQTVATTYYCEVTCSGVGSGSSDPISIGMKAANECYCTPGGVNASYYINNFITTNGIQNISNLGSGFSAGGYGDFTSLTVSQNPGGTVSVATQCGGTSTFGFRIWVDWNQDGVFSSSEIAYSSTAYSNTPSGSFTVPMTATFGTTRMRVGISFTPATGPADPCMTNLSGEFEDYTFVVVALGTCSGTPAPGSTTGPGNACATVPFTLGLSNTVVEDGLSYQWYASTDGGVTYTAVGTNSPSYSTSLSQTTTYYCEVTCAYGSSASSTSLTVNLNPANACFCTPTYSYDCSDGDQIDNFSLTGDDITLTNSNSGCSAAGYGDYTTMPAPSLTAGSTYSGTIGTNSTYTENVRIWIDFNGDGSFSESEVVAELSSIGTSTPFTFTVPTNATGGNQRMRVRLVYYTAPGSIDPCTLESYGETEDYMVNIVVPPCAVPNNIAVTNVTGSSAELSWTDNSAVSYDYELRTSGAAGSGAAGLVMSGNVASGSPAILLSPLSSATTYSVYVRSVCVGETSAWSPASVFTPGLTQIGSGNGTNSYLPIYSCYGYNYSQQIYLSSEYTGQPYITKIAFKYTGGASSTTEWKNWTVFMGNTTKASFASTTDWVPYAQLNQVFSGDINAVAGQWVEISLNPGFLWDGTSNIVVAVDENSPSYSCTASWSSFAAGSNRGMLYYSDGTNPDPMSPPGATQGPTATLAQIRLYSGAMPTCFPPTGLTATNVTASGADLSWNAASPVPSGYEWELRTSGAPGSGNTGLADSGTTAGTTASTSLLAPITSYSLYVRSDCDGDGLSGWAGPYTFSTPCATFTAPYTQNFDASLNTPGCWDNPGPGEQWLFNASGAFGPDYGVAGAVDHTSGSGNYAWIDGSADILANSLESPLIDISGLTNAQVTFWMLSNNTNDVAQNRIRLDVWDGSTWVQMLNYGGNSPNWIEHTAIVPAGIPSVTRFRLVALASTVGGSQFYNDLLIDDFSVAEAPTCLVPTGLMMNSVGSNDASFSWTASLSNPANGYEWEVRTSGAAGSGSSGLAASGTTATGVTSVNVTGLTTGAGYSVYVRAVCGTNDASEWIGPVSFTTGTVQIGTGTATSGYFPIYSCYGYNYSQQIYLASEYTGGSYISKVAFKYTGGASSTAEWKDWVVYMGNTSKASFANTSDWVPYSQLTQVFSGVINAVPGQWMEITLNPGFLWDGTSNIVVAVDENSASYSCTANWAAFASGSNRGILYYSDGTNPNPASPPTANYGPNATIAQVKFTAGAEPTCWPPLSVAVNTVSTNSASFNWTASTSAPSSGYAWEVRTSGTPGSGATGLAASGNTAAGVTTASVTGLSSSTAYSFYVRANCGGGDLSFWAGPVNFSTGSACGDPFYDTGGPSGNYGVSEDWVKTYCASNPGDQVRVLFNSFYTEANYDKLFIFNGPTTAAPKFASSSDAGYGNTSYGAGGWSGDLNSSLPGPFTSNNASGCLTFAFVSDGSMTYAGWEAITQCVEPNNTCSNAAPVLCGGSYPGNTTGVPHNMPASACAFNGPASTGGQNWWTYEATTSEAVTFSTCGSGFDTRISVFTGTDCSNLSCVTMNDNASGCANGGSSITINGVPGTTYWIAVHGAGNASGSYTLSVTCGTVCTPPANDNCSSAQVLANNLADGSNSPASFSNACATADGPTACSGADPVMGVWFSFNSGDYNHTLLTLLDNNQNGQYTAPVVDYALFNGGCSGPGASGSTACEPDGAGYQVLNLTPNTDYLMVVYNSGGANMAGTFGLMVEHPAHNDAAITGIVNIAPGQICGSTMAPVVTLLNNGDNNLTSVTI
ncbi:MAG TPA: GEVED domain-containing protein, partial [Flavobacteriales bacterium]|nr:GEVED domain-containing protein [Flavobacteriales bacterium]